MTTWLNPGVLKPEDMTGGEFIALHKMYSSVSKTYEWEEVLRGDLREVRRWYDSVPQAAKGHGNFRARPVNSLYGFEVYGV